MINTVKSYLLEESLGKQWYFTLNDQQLIVYYRRTEKTWTDATPIDSRAVRHFSVTIDKNDNIHLLAYNTSKQLIYYEWRGEQWYQRLLYPISSRFENISYLELLSIHTHIHLFYYIENSLKRAQESLIHSYLSDGKWNSDVLMNFLTDQSVTPQLIRSDDKGNLFCVYTRRIQNQTRSYYIYYDINSKAWAKPSILFQKPCICSEFNGQTDSSGNFHMVWVEEIGSEYRINYKSINPDFKYTASETVCIHEGIEQVQNPSLHIAGKLYCFWVQDGRGMASQGDASGRHWEIPQLITGESITLYNKIIKSLDGRSNTMPQLGDGFPDFDWTLETILFGGTPKLGRQKSPDHTDDKDEKVNKPVVVEPMDKMKQKIEKLESQLNEAQNRLDDFHAALYELQDYVRQRDKSSFHMETQIRKLSFELEQLRTMRGKIPYTRTVTHENELTTKPALLHTSENGVVIEEKKNAPELEEKEEIIHSTDDDQQAAMKEKKTKLKNVDTGSGEIQLGNVSIRINPVNEEEAD